METKDVKLIPVHPYAYRHNGEMDGGCIVDVIMTKPENRDWRVCYVVSYDDGEFLDYVPISEVEIGNYKIVAV